MIPRILVTRPRSQAEEWFRLFTPIEAEIWFQPTIEITAPEDGFQALDAALNRLESFDWIVFSSANGVRSFLERAAEKQVSVQSSRLAAIGPGTGKALEDAGLRVAFTPEVFQAEFLAEGLVPHAAAGETFLLIRASRGREVLAETLEKAGKTGCVTQAVAYTSRDVTRDSNLWNPEVLGAMQAGRIHWTTVTSSAIAASLVQLFGDALHRTQLASLSSLTTSALKKLGFAPTVEAVEATMPSLAQAIREHL